MPPRCWPSPKPCDRLPCAIPENLQFVPCTSREFALHASLPLRSRPEWSRAVSLRFRSHLHEINRNPFELARVSAGVRSCDVGDRRGCVNVSTVIQALSRGSIWPGQRRSEAPRRRGATAGRIYAGPCWSPIAAAPDRLLGRGRYAGDHGGVDHHDRHLFRVSRRCAHQAACPAGRNAIRLRGPHRGAARAGRSHLEPATARPGTVRAKARQDCAPAGSDGIARNCAQRARRCHRLGQAASACGRWPASRERARSSRQSSTRERSSCRAIASR